MACFDQKKAPSASTDNFTLIRVNMPLKTPKNGGIHKTPTELRYISTQIWKSNRKPEVMLGLQTERKEKAMGRRNYYFEQFLIFTTNTFSRSFRSIALRRPPE